MPTPTAAITQAEQDALDAVLTLRDELDESMIGRTSEIRSLLLALISRQHVLLLGPPGVGKSLLATKLGEAFEAPPLIRLLTAYSLPEEVFGPLSLKALEAGRYERLTDGYLPTVKIALLDEIFKANSGLLNALLTALNERCFDNGPTRQRIPLELVVGCSNEGPQDESLGALYDRFVFRHWVEPISGAADFHRLLTLEDKPVEARLSFEQINVLRARAAALPMEPATLEALKQIWLEARKGEYKVGDRRWKWCVGVARAAAVLNGYDSVSPDCLRPLADVLWDDQSQRTDVRALVERFCFPYGEKLRVIGLALTAAQERITAAGLKVITSDALRALRGDLSNLELDLSKIPDCADKTSLMIRLSDAKRASARLVK